MNTLGIALVWCAVQVTVVALLTTLLYAAARRSGPAARSFVVLTGLAVMLALSAGALSPWPRWGGWLAPSRSTDTPLATAGPADTTPASGERQPPGTNVSTGERSSVPINPQDTPTPAPQGLHDQTGERPSLTADSGLFWQAFFDELRQAPAPQAASAPTWSWPAAVGLLFLAGAGIGLLRLLGGIVAVWNFRRRSRPVGSAALRTLVDALRAELGVRRDMEVRESDRIATAATVGWRRPLILLPADWTGWSDAERRAVLAHEIAHIRRHDFAAWIAAQLGLVLHFYHPLVHWLAGRLRLEQELAADAAAAPLAGGRQAYLKILAEMALRRPERPLSWPARSFLPTRNTFLRRIDMLRNSTALTADVPAFRRWWPAAALVVAGLAAAGLRGSAGDVDLHAQDAAPAARQAQEPIRDVRPGGTGRQQSEPPGTNSDGGLSGRLDPADEGVREQQDPAEQQKPLELSWVPIDAGAVIAVRPKEVLARPEMKEVTKLLAEHPDDRGPDLDLTQVEQITWVFLQVAEPNRNPIFPTLPYGATILRSTPRNLEAFARRLVSEPVESEFAGQTYYRSQARGNTWAYFRPDERTLVVDNEPNLKRFIVSGPQPRSWLAKSAEWKELSDGDLAAAVDFGWLQQMLESGPDFALSGPLGELARSSRGVFLGARLDRRLTLLGSVVLPDPRSLNADAQASDAIPDHRRPPLPAASPLNADAQASDAIHRLRGEGRSLTSRSKREISLTPGPDQAFLLATMDQIDQILNELRVELEDRRVVLRAATDLEPVHVRALAEAVRAAQHAGRRVHSQHNLKMLALAMHNYYDVHQRFPPAIVMGPDGKTPHSWRVAILPYLEHQNLYQQYRLDEPWDSPHNRRLLDEMPEFYRHPFDEPGSTNASYFALTGPATIFPDGEGVRFQQVLDGTSNTLLFAEAKRDIPWTKPEDIPYDAEQPLPELGGFHREGFHAALADGSVRLLLHDAPEALLRAIITKAGGELVNWEQLEAGRQTLRQVPPAAPRP